MARWKLLLICIAGMSLLASPLHADDNSISNERITAAIKKAVTWIYQQQNDWGTWETVKEPHGTQRDRLDQGQFGELTALTLHALLAAGENDRDDRLQKAITFLMISDRIAGVYAVGMRAQVWPELTRSPAVREAMAKDRAILLGALHRTGRTRGLFSFRSDYEAEPDYADHAVSLYGTLGVKALADGGIEIPDEFWHTVDRAWRSQQQKDGSWVFRIGTAAKQEHTMSMTAGGVAVLFSTTDELAAEGTADCTGTPVDKNIEQGLNWIDAHFDQSRDPHELGEYTVQNFGLYAIADIGVASGRKYFNQRDWYQDGAKMLLDAQDKTTGAWSNLPDTCLGILFLARGRNPVIFSKLQYASTAAAAKPAGGKSSRQSRSYAGRTETWNLRPRDVANLTHWIGRQVETEFKWQSVSLKVPVEELHDSAILYVSGNQKLNFNSDEMDKLKTFILEGGLVLGVADCSSPDFSRSFRKLGSDLFPDYEFRNVPRDSVIYTNEEYRASAWRERPPLLELSNGVRDFMLLIPVGDPGRHFQLRQIGSWQPFYELMSDIAFYSVDKDGLRLKGDTYIVRPDPSATVNKTIKVARLEYDGNWDPEPAGWIRLAAVMHNTRGIDLQVTPIRLGEGKLDNSFNVADLTGTSLFHFTENSRAEIKRFVDGGGTLVIDAAGGSAAFAAAAQAEMKNVFPDGNLDILPSEHPVFSSGMSLTRAFYRRFAADRIGQSTDFHLQGLDANGRTAVFFSAEDISAGLVGEPMDGIYGYAPRLATELMANILTYAAGK